MATYTSSPGTLVIKLAGTEMEQKGNWGGGRGCGVVSRVPPCLEGWEEGSGSPQSHSGQESFTPVPGAARTSQEV